MNEVKVITTKLSTMIKWNNTFHPDNVNFMQTVFWYAWLNDNNKIVISYSLQSLVNLKVIKYIDVKDDENWINTVIYFMNELHNKTGYDIKLTINRKG